MYSYKIWANFETEHDNKMKIGQRDGRNDDNDWSLVRSLIEFQINPWVRSKCWDRCPTDKIIIWNNLSPDVFNNVGFTFNLVATDPIQTIAFEHECLKLVKFQGRKLTEYSFIFRNFVSRIHGYRYAVWNFNNIFAEYLLNVMFFNLLSIWSTLVNSSISMTNNIY